MVGGVAVGGGAPVVVQSMTNTDTKDAASTAQQVAELARAGSEIVRITVNNREAAAQVPEIVAHDGRGERQLAECARAPARPNRLEFGVHLGGCGRRRRPLGLDHFRATRD